MVAPALKAGTARPAEGRQRLLAAAERLFATRGFDVPSRVIIAAAGQRNRSAITYHFGCRDGLIDAVCQQHEILVARHRRHLIARLPPAGERTTRQLVQAYIDPLTAEMLHSAPSYWARFSEMLLLDRPLRFTGDAGDPAGTGPGDPADPVLCELLGLTATHLAHLPEQEAADRAALTVRFLVSSLARWERDVQAGTVLPPRPEPRWRRCCRGLAHAVAPPLPRARARDGTAAAAWAHAMASLRTLPGRGDGAVTVTRAPGPPPALGMGQTGHRVTRAARAV